MVKKLREMNWKKAIIMIIAIVLTLSAAILTPIYAAGKAKVTVKVNSPKKNVTLSGTELTAHTKTPIQLTVKGSITKTVKKIIGWDIMLTNGQYKLVPIYKKVKKTGTGDITAKATYKTSNNRIVSVNKKGKLTIKKNGTATITVNYKSVSKNIKVTVSNKHTWKAHTVQKTIGTYGGTLCNCGELFIYDNSYDKDAEKEHFVNHILNGEWDNYTSAKVEKRTPYIDYYYCSCNAKKAGKSKPEEKQISIYITDWTRKQVEDFTHHKQVTC